MYSSLFQQNHIDDYVLNVRKKMCARDRPYTD